MKLCQVSAKEKADQMLQLIGYPDWLLDPAAVDAVYAAAEPAKPADHMGNGEELCIAKFSFTPWLSAQ